jgi:hypothetical protein
MTWIEKTRKWRRKRRQKKQTNEAKKRREEIKRKTENVIPSSWVAKGIHSVGEEIPCSYRTWRFLVAFVEIDTGALSWASWIQSINSQTMPKYQF